MKIEKISKTIVYKNGLRVKLLNEISLDIDEKQITSIIASTGSGKSTLLKIISGLETQDSGNKIDCNASFIPSEPSSFPWFDVEENIQFANEKISSEELKKNIEAVGLTGYEKHFPQKESYGFRFRVSLARALAAKSEAILIDEPFAKMDQRTKSEMLQLLIDVNEKLSKTIIFATSNISEALLISKKTLLMKKGISGFLPTQVIDYKSNNVQERMNSKEFFDYLISSEQQAKENSTQQSFTISL